MRGIFHGGESLRAIWPGQRYVDIVGINGYFQHRYQTYSNLFGPSIAEVRSLSTRPVLVSEVSASRRAGKARAMAELVAGTRRYRTLGFVWFDIDKAHTAAIWHIDWRMEINPGARATFRRFAKAMRKT